MYNKLQEIISSLTQEEKVKLKNYLKNLKSGTKSRKDLRLLYLMVDKNIYDDKELITRLYPSKSKKNVNAFRRLKNRLTEDILNFITIQQVSKNEIMKNLLLAKYFHNKNNTNLAISFLEKSEEEAIKKEQFNILDEIYTTFITLSIDTMTINPTTYIEKRKNNYEKLIKLRKIENTIALIVYKMRTEQNLVVRDTTVINSLKQVLDEISTENEILNSPLFKQQLFKAISRMLLQQHEYEKLLDYCIHTYQDNNNYPPEFLIEVIIFIMNSAYKIRKYQIFKKYYNNFFKTFQKLPENKKAVFKFYVYYYKALCSKLNNNFKETINFFQQALNDETIKKHPLYRAFCLLNIAIMYHNLSDLDNTLKFLNELLNDSSIKKLAQNFLIKIYIFEVIVFYELNELLLAQKRIDNIKKSIKNTSAKISLRDIDFLNLVSYLIKRKNSYKTKGIKKKITEFLNKYAQTYEDIINYNKWLEKIKENL